MSIAVEQLSKIFPPDIVAVEDVSFQVEDGSFAVLLGTSGSGKTTTLKMINRLIEPSAGRIFVGGEDVTDLPAEQLRRGIGYAFQGAGLFPHMSVAQNIAITPELLGWDKSQVRDRVDELLDMVNLPPDEFRDRLPSELSGGQQQRIGFARALAAKPSVVLLDEAFGALDPVTRDEVRAEFHAIHKRLGLTTILVTHDMAEALMLADQIMVMHEGRILQNATPNELVNQPADDYVASLMDAPRHAAHALFALEADR